MSQAAVELMNASWDLRRIERVVLTDVRRGRDARHANGRVDASELEAALEVGGPVIETGEDV